MKYSLPILFSVLIFLTSCSSEEKKNVTVVYHNDFLKNNSVIIDDTMKIDYISDHQYSLLEYCDFTILSGKHNVSINGEIQEIEIGPNGGILNLESYEYVTFPIEYRTANFKTKTLNYDTPIVVDDYVVYSKDFPSSQEKLVEFLKNPKVKEMIMITRNDLCVYDGLFIDKKWDFDIGTLPSQIETTTNRNSETLDIRKGILPAELFLVYAKESDKYYVNKIESPELITLIKSFNEE